MSADNMPRISRAEYLAIATEEELVVRLVADNKSPTTIQSMCREWRKARNGGVPQRKRCPDFKELIVRNYIRNTPYDQVIAHQQQVKEARANVKRWHAECQKAEDEGRTEPSPPEFAYPRIHGNKADNIIYAYLSTTPTDKLMDILN